MDLEIILLIIVILLLIAIWCIYASLIKKKNKVQEAFSSVDVQLNKRYDLIPNILTIAAKFMEHEKTLLEDVTALRSQAVSLSNDIQNLGKKVNLDNEITSKMGQILVAVENYPQLKSDQTMINAMLTYNEVEEHISAARRFYNSAVLELNNAVEIFPTSLFATIMNIPKQEFFKAGEIARQRIDAKDFFNK